ncbi:MAG: hypothetical protein EBZ15_02560 [Actinobacteria bacterium]|nr:hypothetical protein [Actinomycetota bacterium]
MTVIGVLLMSVAVWAVLGNRVRSRVIGVTGSPGSPEFSARRGRQKRERKSSDVGRSDEISLQASVVADVLAATLAAGAPIEAALPPGWRRTGHCRLCRRHVPVTCSGYVAP